MGFLRRSVCAVLLALPIWLAAPASAGAHVVTADLNGDGVRDRIETGSFSAEVVVHLSGSSLPQRLRAIGSILDVFVTDIDGDGNRDLVAATRVRHHLRLVIWTNTGRGQLVSRHPRARDSLDCGRIEPSPTAKRLTNVADDDICRDTCRELVLSATGARDPASAGSFVPGASAACTLHPRYTRSAPRGPPSSLLLS